MSDEEEASDNHLALLLLLMPILARIRARIERFWEHDKASVKIGEFAEESIIDEVTTLVMSSGGNDPPPEVIETVANLALMMEQHVRKARIMLFDASTLEEAMKAVDVLDVAVSKIETVNSNVEVKAENERTKTDRNIDDEEIVWDAERDACIRCLAYAGKTMDSDGRFDGVNKFGLPPLSTEVPPLHPNCRCKVRRVSKSLVASVVEAMEREAERSIMRGFSRPSESNANRLRATRSLLARGSDLPSSVQAYGRRSIRQGDYPRGRDVPSG